MITKLHIKNIGIIEDVEIDFNKGLNVLTGETGAGKTLIIDSLGIICGDRFSKEMIRRGASNSYIDMCMYEPENINAIEGNIIVSREINESGRNICKINGRMVTVNELKDFMSKLIEIHGQNENQKLYDAKEHINYLDGYAGEEIITLKQDYIILYNKFNEIIKELKANYGDDKEKQRKIDLLNYQINEINNAKLRINEDNELEEKHKIMINVEKIEQNLNETEMLICENTIDTISAAIKSLEKISHIDEKYENSANSLKDVYYELQEISRDLFSFKDDVYFDETERNEIEERLDLIQSLKRKYGNSIEEILEYNKEMKNEVDLIENLEEHNLKLKDELDKIQNEMEELAYKMHKIRVEKSKELSESINQNLKELEMKNAKINIYVDYQEIFNEHGKDKVKFFIQTNLGEEEKELNKIASGGEISRIMLAIKSVLANTDDISVMVFDEIDTGISGKAANSVAEKLSNISKKHQVLCISHLPNIAAHADYNYFISKNVKDERTSTNIKLLTEEEVINEIARISSGEINEATIKYANELRNKKKI